MEQALLQEYKDMQVTLNGLKLEIETLPKGYIRSREIAGKYYYYLQYREGDTVRSDYLNEEERNTVSEKINKRKDLQCQKAELEKSLRILEQNLGIHHYRPIKNIDYSEYTLFISYIAHEYKRLGKMSFLASFDIQKYRGVKKKYLKGFVDYIAGEVLIDSRRSNDLILDPYTYQMYFEYGDKSVLEEELEKAIPAFLNQGLLITEVQEAVA